MIGSALVGTFMGVLLAYGIVAPLASRLKQVLDQDEMIFQAVKQVIIASLHGWPQPLVVEARGRVLATPSAPACPNCSTRCAAAKGRLNHGQTSQRQERAPPAPIIVKKVTVVAGGHHGGAWKVAYADFVTAMMAFFLLLWLLGATTEKQRKGLADYFTPTLVKMKEGEAGSYGLLGGSSITDADNYPHKAAQTGTKTLTVPRDATAAPRMADRRPNARPSRRSCRKSWPPTPSCASLPGRSAWWTPPKGRASTWSTTPTSRCSASAPRC
jgi:hypothetical protein